MSHRLREINFRSIGRKSRSFIIHNRRHSGDVLPMANAYTVPRVNATMVSMAMKEQERGFRHEQSTSSDSTVPTKDEAFPKKVIQSPQSMYYCVVILITARNDDGPEPQK